MNDLNLRKFVESHFPELKANTRFLCATERNVWRQITMTVNPDRLDQGTGNPCVGTTQRTSESSASISNYLRQAKRVSQTSVDQIAAAIEGAQNNDRAGYQAPARSSFIVNIPMRPDLRPDPSESREIPDPDAFTHLDIMIAR